MPTANRLAGHIPQLLADSLGHMHDSHLSHGHAIAMRLGPRWLYSFSHPDDVSQILQEGWRTYSKRTRVYQLLVPLLGTGLFTSDGDAWKNRRKLSQPAFHHRMMEHYAAVMADEGERTAHRWSEQGQIEVAPESAETALRIITRTTLGVSISGQEGQVIRESLQGSIAGITERVHSVLSLPLWVPTAANRALNRHLRTLHGLVDDIIERGGSEQDGTLASVLYDGGLSTRELRDDLITFVFAGHESSATALAWTLYLLSQHPRVASDVRDELSLLRGAPAGVDDLDRLGLLDRVIRESLRLYPPQWGMGRNADVDSDLGDVHIPRGTIVGIHSWVTHRHPELWEEPEAFRPQRWEKPSPEQKRAWFPFGAGPRNCIGQAFATMELKILLSILLPRFELDIAPSKPTAGLVLAPDGPMRAEVSKVRVHAAV